MERSRLLSKRQPSCSVVASSLSPMTDLAFNLGELSTRQGETPKRRISWSSPCKNYRSLQLTYDDGSADSPGWMASPALIGSNRMKAGFAVKCPSGPPPDCEEEPACDKENDPGDPRIADDHDGNSHDSGFSDKEESVHRREYHFSDPATLPNPNRMPSVYPGPERGAAARTFSAPTDPTFSAPRRAVAEREGEVSPCSSNSRPRKDDCDDEFLDFGDDADDANVPLPDGFSSLLSGPIPTGKRFLVETCCDTEAGAEGPVAPDSSREPHKVRSCMRELFLNNDGGSNRSRCHFKRPEPPQNGNSPIVHKRRKSLSTASCYGDNSTVKVALQRCHSETEATIKSALSRSIQEPDLVGDFSKPYVLPLTQGRHHDLKSVSPQTLCDLIRGRYDDEVGTHVIVDCRYPYEYEGGHIKGALNIYNKEGILKELLMLPMRATDAKKRVIVIFHCEFSSERGPNLVRIPTCPLRIRFLRCKDREANKECYPSLHYPELYLLLGGYKAFYGSHKELCDPQSYKPMLHKDHEDDLRNFRAKSKSWNGEKGRSVRPGLKF